MASSSRPASTTATPFWRNEKSLALLIQAGFVIAVVALFWFLISNMQARLLATKGVTGLRFNFLNSVAGFEIGEGISYTPQDSFGRAFIVGLVNTLSVSIIGIVLATILGLFAGIARLSDNWLLSRLTGVYIEIIRSTPLLLQLFFWYFGVILALPDINSPLNVAGLALLSNRGIALATINLTATGTPWQWWLLAALLIAITVGWLRHRHQERAGRVGSGLGWALAAFALVALIGYFVTDFTALLPTNIAYQLERGDRGLLFVDSNGNGLFDEATERPLPFVNVTLLDEQGNTLGDSHTNSSGEFRFYNLPDEAKGASIQWQKPEVILIDRPLRQGFNFIGGARTTPEFAALLLGLVVYTGAFIAEIVRAGISAVPKGQTESARALGLSGSAILRWVVIPQALRIIIPPLTNQYLNLIKNSSLAVAIGYPDLFNVSMTILNQTGAEVQMFLLIIAIYLLLSLITSLFMNWYNQRIAFSSR